jgi:hypothetical protein
VRAAAGLAALALVATAAGCKAHHGAGPAEAFVHFVADAGANRVDAAWARLSEGTREAADQLGARQSPPVAGRRLLLGGQLTFTHGVQDVTEVSRHGDRAVLRVTADDGTTRKVSMHREDGAWKVVLPLP